MGNKINKIISFKISGKFAHFRKFYTNASSLSYLIPPRTTLSGMLASILKIPRDEYYERFNQEKIKISVSIPKGLKLRSQTQSMNYLHKKYYDLIAKGTESGKIQHSQCKLELLMYPVDEKIEYIVYVGGNSENDDLKRLENKIKQNQLGYGCYLGQRQFKADVEFLSSFDSDEIEFLGRSDFLDSIINERNLEDYELDSEINLISEQMPIHFKKAKTQGREPINIGKIYFEKEGRRLKGRFLNCYKIENKYISFY